MADAPELSWRIFTAAEQFQQRKRRWRMLLTAAAVGFVIAFSFSSETRWLALLITAVLTAIVWFWHHTREQARNQVAEPNVRLSSAGFQWRKQHDTWELLPREAILSYRLNPLLRLNDEPFLVFVLRDQFESQPIYRGTLPSWELVHQWLHDHWNLAEDPSPAASAVIIDAVRWGGFYEYDLPSRQFRWLAEAREFSILLAALRRVADELPLPPHGAQPQWLELVGNEEGEELLLGIDREPWIEGSSIAAPAEWFRSLAGALEAARTSDQTELTIEMPTVAGTWKIGYEVLSAK